LGPGASIIKLFTTVFNFVTKKASVFVKASQNLLIFTKHYGIYYGRKKFYDTGPPKGAAFGLPTTLLANIKIS
jgi:hypothetical protein